jgi:FixJ family two-component response regulator/anti-sigma regulatory factor (Ser/Thr protein kinase)
MSSANSNASNHKPGLLVVDDDSISRELLRLVLAKCGYEVAAVESGAAAQEKLLAAGTDAFDCVISDHQMPGMSGLELLAWLETQAPDVATIIITGAGEKQVVTNALRGGAMDFIEKPVKAAQLCESVAKAVEITRARRHARQMQSAVKDLGRAQQWMIQSQAAGEGLKVEHYFHPKLEAGGDSFSQFQTDPNRHFCLLTDVSGHDLRAAYLSAYFQGIVRGMLECGRPITDIFRSFNRYLVEEWNKSAAMDGPLTAGTSVAACSVSFDLQRREASFLTCGIPGPVRVEAGGRARIVGRHGGSALGWFPEFSEGAVIDPIHEDELVLLRTDGMDDLADKLGVHPLSIAYRLWTNHRQRAFPELRQADDDILFTVIHLLESGLPQLTYLPVVLETYRGDQTGQVDTLAKGWGNSLRLSLPELAETDLHNIVAAAREGVLNGLWHGCSGDAAKELIFQISIEPTTPKIRVWVEDSGPGYAFALAAPEPASPAAAPAEPRGLTLIRQLAERISFERNRATLIMDFRLT